MTTELSNPDAPYALQHPEEQQRRTALLDAPHIAPLVAYRREVMQEVGEQKAMPQFDPCDGGVDARALFLLEAPGPKAVGSTFISRNNPDPTARNMCLLMQQAGIPRAETLLWNIVPWYVGDETRIRAVTNTDIREAMPHFQKLLQLLPRLEAIVLVGQKAQSAAMEIRKLTPVPFFYAPHMSARVFNVWPEKQAEAETVFRRAAQLLHAAK
jgi:uracil-DNA glycosylase